MAKKEKEIKIVAERTYIVPLRRAFGHVPEYKRAKKAMTELKAFLVRHMKSDNVLIGRHLNMKLWENGIRNPPHHVKVNVTKDEEGKVMAELFGAPEEKKEPETKGKKAPKKHDEAPKAGDEKAEELKGKVEAVKEEKAEKAKEIQKEELRELKQEKPKQHAPRKEAKEKKVDVRPTAPSGRGEMRKP